MRRITIIVLAVSMLFQLTYAQRPKFKMANGILKEGEVVGGLFNLQNESFWAIIGSPAKKQGMVQLYSYSLKQFNQNLAVINTRNLPDFAPSNFTTFQFGNYLVFNGANDVHMTNSSRKENFLVFTDNDFKLIKQVNRKVEDDGFRFTDDFSLSLSDDSSKLISMVLQNEAVGKPGKPKYKAIIEVYDSKLEVVWQKSFYTSDYFGSDPRPIRCSMTKDDNIIIIASERDGSDTKLNVCVFKEQQSEPLVSTRTYDYSTTSFRSYIKEPGTLIIGGLASNADEAKEMFYLEYDLSKNEFSVENTIKLDKSFGAAYPDMSKAISKSYPKSSFYSTDFFIPFGEGSLMIFDGSYYLDGKFNPRPVAFIFLNSEGQAKWVKLIPRFTQTEFFDFSTYSVFQGEDKLQIFYGADAETEGKMDVPFGAKDVSASIGMFYSVLDASGEMTRGKLLASANLEGFGYSISGMERLKNNIFITVCKRYKNRLDRKPAMNVGIISLIDK